MTADLRARAVEYVQQRRARGYKLRDEEAILVSFAEALDARGADRITVVDVLAFAQKNPALSRATQARRFGIVRGFALWLRALDPDATELIPPGLIRGAYQRVNPHLYSPAQVHQLLAATQQLPKRWLAEAMYVLIGLLYVSGMRSGEAFGLDVEDFDICRHVLEVHGKLGRQRLVPVHPSTAEKLSRYCQGRTCGPLLIGPTGGRLSYNTAHGAFRRLLTQCVITAQPGARPARLHDFRHTLAVDTLVDAHRKGLDVDARLAVLSTFLGHVDVLNTYWYLTASPELMTVVSDRMATALGRSSR
ncbi:MAG TPA: tyrosine-type recombinase/integrase [Pseudonocardiaceae bacterium]